MSDSGSALGGGRAERLVVQLTQGGIENGYVSLAEHLRFFPEDAIGAANARNGEGIALVLHFAGQSEPVLTDITADHKSFRRRKKDHGWKRFFAEHDLVPGDSVVIERLSDREYRIAPLAEPAASQAGVEWNAAEVRAVVSDYLQMLAAETAGRPYSKAEHRRRLQAELRPGRTLQAIEFKHANISAVMIELGLPYIRGYKPRGNYQAELASEIRRRAEDGHLLASLRAGPPPAPISGLQQTPPPPATSRKRSGTHIDYGLLQEENRKLGSLGEELVFEFEVERLRREDRVSLADRVRWTARDEGDGLGYDVLSFDASGNERHIEVKTTALGAETPFYISSAELEFARRHPGSFALYRVYNVRSEPTFYVLDGDITAALDLLPTVYRARLKA